MIENTSNLKFEIDNSFFIYFSNKEDYVSNNDDLNILNILKLNNKKENFIHLKQVHTDQIITINNIDCFIKMQNSENLIQGDALITNIKDLSLVIKTADCIPIILIDEKNKICANIHAGHRGLKLNIISKTLEKLLQIYKTNKSEIKAFLGPSIKSCCYEVKNDFLENFDQSFFQYKDNKIYINLKDVAINELIKNNVSNIINIDICTCCNKNFFSYRREKNNKRLYSIVSLS